MQKTHLSVAYQNQFDDISVLAYWLPSNIPANLTDSCLSLNELSTITKITDPKIRLQKYWSFFLTRTILGEVLEKPPESLLINRKTKPQLPNESLHFNVSHSDNLWIITWSFNRPVGIDVQKIDLDINYQNIVKKIFPDSERKKIKNELDFFVLWTQKEAYLKLHSFGFSNITKPLDTNNTTYKKMDISENFIGHLAIQTN